jgi:hypothetical protein
MEHSVRALSIRVCSKLLEVSAVAVLLLCLSASAQDGDRAHGLWVWKGPSLVAESGGAEKLRDFCRSEGINEIYISVSSHGEMLQGDFPTLIDVLHRSNVHVEALLSSETADQPGKYREKLLEQVRQVIRFNQNHRKRSFDGIHLDIEPQQRPENKGPGNLRFLSVLVETYGAVRQLAEPAGLEVNADIQNKLLKGDLGQRRMLLTSLPRLTLMLYEVSNPNDGESTEQKKQKIQEASQKFLNMAYDGLQSTDAAKMNLATMTIGLRTPDYDSLLPGMLGAVEGANLRNPHYAGWAWHSYNDSEKSEP